MKKKENVVKKEKRKTWWWWLNEGDNNDLTCSFLFCSLSLQTLMKTSGVGHLLGLVHARETAYKYLGRLSPFLSLCIVCPLNQMCATYTNTYNLFLSYVHYHWIIDRRKQYKKRMKEKSLVQRLHHYFITCFSSIRPTENWWIYLLCSRDWK